MATVFLARLEGVAGFQRMYAIKRLHPHLASEGEFVDMFLDEARLAARIHHPNVVSILEVGTSEQGYYLVMEYIEGDTAARLLARAAQGSGRLPPAAAIRIGLDTLAGLHAAHELADDEGRPLHIVHRDVSPQNILVGIDGTSRITDFGVAHAASRLSSTRTGQLKGKLAYMAPEQTRGSEVDRRSDVFAMGVVAWEMLAGKRLFRGSNDAETLHRILFAPIPTLRGAGIDVPIPLDAVCMRALAREPENRYGSAAEFADELERVARSLGMLATTRDIASYVDGTIGAEISQQREVVRMWLSRSEPSRNERMSVSGPLARPTSGVPPSFPSAPKLPRISSRDLTTAATPSRAAVPAMPKRGDVSSVSSAVLQVAEATTTDSKVFFPDGATAAGAMSRKAKRRALVGLAVGSGALALLLAGLLVPRPRSSSSTRSATQPELPRAPSPSALAPPPVSPGPVSPPSVQQQPVPSASPLPSAAASTPARPPRATGWQPRPGRSNRGGPAAPSAPEDPDDLSHNPYR